jgi:hypothetical protein
MKVLMTFVAEAAGKHKATPIAVKSMTAIYGKKVAERLISACESLSLSRDEGMHLNLRLYGLVVNVLAGYTMEVPRLKVSMETVKELEVLAEWNASQLNPPRFTSALDSLRKDLATLPAKSPIWKPIRKRLAAALGVKETTLSTHSDSVSTAIGMELFQIRMHVSPSGKAQWTATYDRFSDIDDSVHFKGKSSSDPLMYKYLAEKRNNT